MVYLDNSATTLIKPDCVYEEVMRVMKENGGNAGRGGHSMSVLAADVIYKARENVAKLFNIDNESAVCFTYNASHALNYAVKGVVKKGDHVIISSFEHNSVYRPIYSMVEKGITFTVLPSDEEGNFDNIENYIRKNTKLILINHVSNVTGNIAEIRNIAKVARKNDVLFMIDASQSAGHIDIDVQRDGIDILACSGHKGLFGPQGTGVLYIAPWIETETVIEGGTGSMSLQERQPDELPDRFETGTLNAPGIGGLSKGIEFLLDTGTVNIRKHEKRLLSELISGLNSVPGVRVYGNRNPEKTSGAIGFNVSGWDSVMLCEYLDQKYKTMLRGGLHCSSLAHKTLGTEKCGCARASISYFSTQEDINYFLNIMHRIEKKIPSICLTPHMLEIRIVRIEAPDPAAVIHSSSEEAGRRVENIFIIT